MRAFLYTHIWHDHTCGVFLLLACVYFAISANDERMSFTQYIWAVLAGAAASLFVHWMGR